MSRPRLPALLKAPGWRKGPVYSDRGRLSSSSPSAFTPPQRAGGQGASDALRTRATELHLQFGQCKVQVDSPADLFRRTGRKWRHPTFIYYVWYQSVEQSELSAVSVPRRNIFFVKGWINKPYIFPFSNSIYFEAGAVSGPQMFKSMMSSIPRPPFPFLFLENGMFAFEQKLVGTKRIPLFHFTQPFEPYGKYLYFSSSHVAGLLTSMSQKISQGL